MEEKEIDKEEKKSHLDHEVNLNIKFNPKKLMKWSAYIIIILAIFFVGRISAPGPTAEIVLEEESTIGFTGWITGLFAGDGEEEETETTATTEEVTVDTEEITEPAADTEETTEAEETTDTEEVETTDSPTAATVVETGDTEEEEEEEEEEPIITTYSKIAVSLNTVHKDWKGTWGKITKLTYTIKNSETGTVKPSHFSMAIEGYDEAAEKKKVPLPISSKTIKSGESVTGTVDVPSGFAYARKTAGLLKNVQVSLILFDSDNKPMASFMKEFDLSGPEE